MSQTPSNPAGGQQQQQRGGAAAAYAKYLPPKTGLSVNVRENGNPDSAIARLHRMGMDTGLMRDWTYKSPLAPGTNRYEKPNQTRQRLERHGAFQYKQKQLLTILRTVLFKKTRG